MGAFDVNKTSCTFAKQSSPSKRRGVTGVKAKGGRRRRRRWGVSRKGEKFPLQVKTTGRCQRRGCDPPPCWEMASESEQRCSEGLSMSTSCIATFYTHAIVIMKRLRCSPLLLRHSGVFTQWMLITKELKDEMNLNSEG